MELSTTTTTIDGDRIQEYAKKLRQGNFLETLALNVAMGIHAEITTALPDVMRYSSSN
jgi:hypothetical protein